MNLSKILLPLLTFSVSQLLGYDNESECNHQHHKLVQDEWAKETKTNLATEFPEPLIISLGYNCQTATNMQKNNLRTFAFPFDWMGCSFEGLCSLLENDFQDFLNPAYLYKKDGSNIVINRKYNLGFWHDFPTYQSNGRDWVVPNWVDSIPDVTLKYQRRIKRLYKALNSDRTIYLFRSACSRDWILGSILQTRDMVIKLQAILQNKFPKAHFILVVISEKSDVYYNMNWDIPGVKNFYMQDFGMSHEWTRIFRELNLIQ